MSYSNGFAVSFLSYLFEPLVSQVASCHLDSNPLLFGVCLCAEGLDEQGQSIGYLLDKCFVSIAFFTA
jgi:hypothetical protein